MRSIPIIEPHTDNPSHQMSVPALVLPLALFPFFELT